MADPSHNSVGNQEVTNTSPNGEHNVRLRYENEIRFGPPYFKLELDGRVFLDRIFGEPLCWSANSRYVGAQEWLTTRYEIGPITRVLLIDIDTNRCSEFKVIEQGFAEGFRFEESIFIYRKHFCQSDRITEVEVDITRITNWEDCNT